LDVEAVKTSSTPLNRATCELHPDAMPATSNTAQLRARSCPFAFKTLSRIAVTRTYPVLTVQD
jgi:hypothetical protein